MIALHLDKHSLNKTTKVWASENGKNLQLSLHREWVNHFGLMFVLHGNLIDLFHRSIYYLGCNTRKIGEGLDGRNLVQTPTLWSCGKVLGDKVATRFW